MENQRKGERVVKVGSCVVLLAHVNAASDGAGAWTRRADYSKTWAAYLEYFFQNDYCE